MRTRRAATTSLRSKGSSSSPSSSTVASSDSPTSSTQASPHHRKPTRQRRIDTWGRRRLPDSTMSCLTATTGPTSHRSSRQDSDVDPRNTPLLPPSTRRPYPPRRSPDRRKEEKAGLDKCTSSLPLVSFPLSFLPHSHVYYTSFPYITPSHSVPPHDDHPFHPPLLFQLHPYRRTSRLESMDCEWNPHSFTADA